jgi:tetratricopeptide (TPR) repeat protein
MKLLDKDLEQLEAYYNKTLPEKERQAFENRLASDKEFEQAVLEYQKITKALYAIKRGKRLDFLKEIDSQMPPIPQPKVINMKRMLAIAATVLVGALALWQVINLNTHQSELKAYFKPYSSHASTKGIEVEDKQTLAYRAYDNGDYAKAIPLFKSAFAESPNTMLLFFEGVSQVGSGQSEAAIMNLEKLIGSELAPQEILPYYLGLAYADKNQLEKAVAALKKASDTEGGHQQAAKDALIFVESKIKK